jgi:hypothetical protein
MYPCSNPELVDAVLPVANVMAGFAAAYRETAAE